MNCISLLVIITGVAEGKIRAVNNQLPVTRLLISEMSTSASHRYMAVVSCNTKTKNEENVTLQQISLFHRAF